MLEHPIELEKTVEDIHQNIKSMKNRAQETAVPTIPITPVENQNVQDSNSDAALNAEEEETHDLESEAESQDFIEDQEAAETGLEEGKAKARNESSQFAIDNSENHNTYDGPLNTKRRELAPNNTKLAEITDTASPEKAEDEDIENAVEEAEKELKKKPQKKVAAAEKDVEGDEVSAEEEGGSGGTKCQKETKKLQRAKHKVEAAKKKVDKLEADLANDEAKQLKKKIEQEVTDAADEEEA